MASTNSVSFRGRRPRAPAPVRRNPDIALPNDTGIKRPPNPSRSTRSHPAVYLLFFVYTVLSHPNSNVRSLGGCSFGNLKTSIQVRRGSKRKYRVKSGFNGYRTLNVILFCRINFVIDLTSDAENLLRYKILNSKSKLIRKH